MRPQGIAIVGLACRFPDAASPAELWDNVLAQRRAFRRIPDGRLRAEDYIAPDGAVADRTYVSEAAVIEGYAFDRLKYRVSKSTYEATDPAHWLALDVAAEALADAGFEAGEGLPKDSTGVILGNTLTGEISRAFTLRLRWPYVKRVVTACLADRGWSAEDRHDLVMQLEHRYKEPFPPIGPESLAGGLSNTISGRICNHFDLRGGGYTVDGACASSALSLITACTSLANGDLDVGLAGGVDISLDPFELVGFAKLGALAHGPMRVFDNEPTGFLPGEGCGIAVLMRLEDAVAENRRIYAVIRGWGMSSDGSGGITRPEVLGQLLAIRRAYRKAGFGPGTVGYFEGHGTGTEIGDATELEALSRARLEDDHGNGPAVIGSIKANIGHTKAAAGVAGLIKAALALDAQILPPSSGCETPHEKLARAAAPLCTLERAECWPNGQPQRAAVSAMGFGGINTHLVLERPVASPKPGFTKRERLLSDSAQDCELFLFDADDPDQLARSLRDVRRIASGLSDAELGDLAVDLSRSLNTGRLRAAVVASKPRDLTERLDSLVEWLDEGTASRLVPQFGTFLGAASGTPRIGLLLPGQAAPVYLKSGALGRRFGRIAELYAQAALPTDDDPRSTAVAQPAIVVASLAALACLEVAGIEAELALGHSLGELVAYHWAGAIDAATLLHIAKVRGRVMSDRSAAPGAMARLALGAHETEALIDTRELSIACYNGPEETVVSGAEDALDAVVSLAQARGISAQRLPVSLAFHSHLVTPSVPSLKEFLRQQSFAPLARPVFSTVDGDRLSDGSDLIELLARQIVAPVRFQEAVEKASLGLDLWIEAGPGRGLARLTRRIADLPVVSMDAGGPSLDGYLSCLGAAFALGASLNCEALFGARFARPFDRNRQQVFITNPCERAPVLSEKDTAALVAASQPARQEQHQPPLQDQHPAPELTDEPPRDVLRRLVANRVELPFSSIGDDDRLLGDLHLDSITVSELVTEAARCLGLTRPAEPTIFANASIAEIAAVFEQLDRGADDQDKDSVSATPPGVDSWVRCFTHELVERDRPPNGSETPATGWRVFAAPEHPLAEPLRKAFDELNSSGGVVVCLASALDEGQQRLLLDGVHAVLKDPHESRFVLVQHGAGAAALARTLHLEARSIDVAVVDLPLDHPSAVDWVVAEALAASGFSEVHYDAAGVRREPELRLLSLAERPSALVLGPNDVLLVTGGGKGICAECALRLAQSTGVRLALIGRSDPDADPALAENLERMAAQGVEYHYVSADVCDAQAVRTAVAEVERHFGPITALLHGAARNEPCPLDRLDIAELRATLAPKVEGLRNLIEALDIRRLRLLVAFGSLIARTGLPGAGHYALANELLTRQVEKLQAEHPSCRCLVPEWSVWSEIGMGARLGSVDLLARQGIDAISPDRGLGLFEDLLGRDLPAVAVTVTSRFGAPRTLRMPTREPLFCRFLESVRIFYPGIELVADAEISRASDPYVEDHVLGEDRLFPGVMGLEAMAQAAMSVTGSDLPPAFEDVRFDRPIVIAKDSGTTIRLAALARDPQRVEVVVRCSTTDFQVNHFRAVCRFDGAAAAARPNRASDHLNGNAISLDLERDLYGSILFHNGRFRRVSAYRWLHARECVAEIAAGDSEQWFSRYLPNRLVLGDPGARDAAFHAIQACIPHRTLLPVAIEGLEPGLVGTNGPWLVCAAERSADGKTFVYDLEIRSLEGQVLERCSGLKLRAVEDRAGGRAVPRSLLGPYLERRIADYVEGRSLQVALESAPETSPRARGARVLRMAAGAAHGMRRRFDGKPELVNGGDRDISLAHSGDTTLAVTGRGPIGCDVETVVHRLARRWRDLLGSERFALATHISRECSEDLDAAGTRVWAVGECLKKAGLSHASPVLFQAAAPDGWVRLNVGTLVALTYIEPAGQHDDGKCFAFITESGNARV